MFYYLQPESSAPRIKLFMTQFSQSPLPKHFVPLLMWLPLLPLTNFYSSFTIQINAAFDVKFSSTLWKMLVIPVGLPYFSYYDLYHIALYLFANLFSSLDHDGLCLMHFCICCITIYLVYSRCSGKFC